MRYPIRRRLHAQNQIELHVHRLAERNVDAAIRFIDALEDSLALLSRWPELGPRYESAHPRLAALRKWFIPGLTNYLVFYVFEADTIHLIDVIDARSDYAIDDLP